MCSMQGDRQEPEFVDRDAAAPRCPEQPGIFLHDVRDGVQKSVACCGYGAQHLAFPPPLAKIRE